MKSKSTIFLTGATGLVGSYLLRILLKNNHKVYCLARAKKKKSAKERVKDVLNFWDREVLRKHKDNLVVLEGDITKKNLGLTNSKVSLLKKEINEIFHCAAVTRFNWLLNKIRKVNVGGTKNVLKLALQCKNLKKVNHISTAYVCGDYKGVFKETDLDVGQSFNTTYLRSKFEAEKLVHKYREKGLWVDIFRLPLVLGETISGKILKFDNIYQILSICSSQIFDTLPLLDTYLFAVPVDYVCFALYILSRKERMYNKTYHLFSCKPFSLEKIIEIFSKIVNFKKPRLVSFENFDRRDFTPAQKLLLNSMVFSENLNPEINSDFTNNILRKYHFCFPRVNERFLRSTLKYFINSRAAFLN